MKVFFPMLLTLLLSFMARPALAQTVVPSVPQNAEVWVIAATGDPTVLPILGLQVTPISATSANCNQPPLPAVVLPLQNPTQAEIDDPFHPGLNLHCRLVMPTGLPNALAYRTVAVLTVPTCSLAGVVSTPCDSLRSAVGVPSFDIVPILGPPVAPTGLGIRR